LVLISLVINLSFGTSSTCLSCGI